MKEKFIKSTIILLIGGFITKILGMIIKILMSRMIGTDGLGLYMMILPTFSLFIGLSQFGLPIALSKLVSENNKNNIKLVFSTTFISLIVNLFLMTIIIIISPFLANNLLHNSDSYLGILAIAFVIPFTSVSSICRSYFFGKEKMLPHVISNISEDIIRLVLMIIGIPYFLEFGIKYVVCFIILSNICSELFSIIILILFLPKDVYIKKSDFKPSIQYIKDSLDIGIPNTTSRLIGSFGYFLEPIILSNVLVKLGYSNNYITTQYGILSGYVLPLLLLPSFFTLAISQALLPIVSREYFLGNKKLVSKKIKQAISISLLIGIPTTICFMIFPKFFLKLMYNTTLGSSYMFFLAPICLFQYVQAPLSFSLDAMGKSIDSMKCNLLGVFIRTSLLFLLSLLKIGIWGLIIAISINVVIVTIYEIKKVREALLL